MQSTTTHTSNDRTTAPIHTRANQSAESARQLGWWSAVISTAASVLWFITFALQDAIAPVPTWRDLNAYADAFSPARLLYIYPSLVLAVTFLVLLVSIDRFVAEPQRIWSRIALSLGVVYATMASINYNIQAVAVRQSLREGDTAGLTPFLPDNPHGVFTALANSYVYMAVAMVFLAPIFTSGRLETWIRTLLFAQGISVVGQIGWSMFGLSEGLFFAFSLVWIVGAPVAFTLIAIWFKRTDPFVREQLAM